MGPDRVPFGLTRTSSVASCVSSDPDEGGKRTRKRFTNSQVVMLEQLYQASSHPIREERELVARELNLELKSVNIWFQNKRQSERRALRTAASDPKSPSTQSPPPSSPFSTTSASSGLKRVRGRGRSLAAFSSPLGPSGAHPMSRSHSSPLPYSTPHSRGHPYARTPSSESFSIDTAPTLDALAARSELRTRTPRQTRVPFRAKDDEDGGLWDNMPSSPLAPESPELAKRWGRERGMVEYGRRGTLEWACAKERVKRVQSEEAEVDVFGDGEKMEVDDDSGNHETQERGVQKKVHEEDEDEDPLPGTTKCARMTRARTRQETAKQKQAQSQKAELATKTTARGEKKTAPSRTTSVMEETASEDTEEEEHEAITPMGSLSCAPDAFWDASSAGATSFAPMQVPAVPPKARRVAHVAVEEQDDELMSAALVLCGLGRLPFRP